MIGVTFVRQPNGTYLRTDGDWPSGARAQIQHAEDQRPFGNYTREEAIKFLEEAIAKNQVRKDRYAVVPNTEIKQSKTQADEAEVAAAKEKKTKKRADKKVVAQERKAEEMAKRDTPKQRKQRVATAQIAAQPGTETSKIDPAKVVQMYRNGVKIQDIACAFGYPRGQGNNRIRGILKAADAYTPKGGAQTTSDANSSAS